MDLQKSIGGERENNTAQVSSYIMSLLNYSYFHCCCSVTKSCPTLQPHGLQHTRLLYISLSLGICSNSCSLSRWCHPIISSSVYPFFSCPQSFPASVFSNESGGQSTGAWPLASTLPMNIQDWFPIGLTLAQHFAWCTLHKS